MPRTKRDFVESFIAVDNKSNEYVIKIFQETIILDVGCSKSGPVTHIEGDVELETEDGHEVTCIKKGEYIIVTPNILLTSDDPKAP